MHTEMESFIKKRVEKEQQIERLTHIDRREWSYWREQERGGNLPHPGADECLKVEDK